MKLFVASIPQFNPHHIILFLILICHYWFSCRKTPTDCHMRVITVITGEGISKEAGEYPLLETVTRRRLVKTVD
jgi:hypothetical protein